MAMIINWVADPETRTLFVVPPEAVCGVEEPLQVLSDKQAVNAFYAGFNVPDSLTGEMHALLSEQRF